jgi:hypothetical protein
VTIYNTSTQQFSYVDLPGSAIPNQVAFSGDGLLGIATSTIGTPSGGLSQLDTSVQEQTSPPSVVFNSLTVSAQGRSFLTASSRTDVQTTSVPQSASSNAALSQTDTTIPGVQLLLGPSPEAASGGAVIVGTTEGFVSVDPTTNSDTTIQLPSVACEGNLVQAPPNVAGGSATTTTPPAQGSSCRQEPLSFAVDPAGNVWSTTTGSATAVVEIPSSTLQTGSN